MNSQRRSRNPRSGRVRSGRKPQGAARRSVATASIPQINTNIKLSHRYRFLATSALTNVGVDAQDLLGAIGGVCTVANTTLSFLAKTMRIQSIEIWSPTATSTTGVTCSIEWLSTNSPSIEVSDTSINVSEPAHILTSPPKLSLAAFWQQTASTDLFIINCPGGSVVDIRLSYVLCDQTTASSSRPITTGTLGRQYYLAMDGPTTNLLVPVSLSTTS